MRNIQTSVNEKDKIANEFTKFFLNVGSNLAKEIDEPGEKDNKPHSAKPTLHFHQRCKWNWFFLNMVNKFRNKKVYR